MEGQNVRPSVGGKNAGYLLEFKNDGVYLTIYPNVGDSGLFELSDIRQLLQDNGVIEYDIIELSRFVREAAGEPRKLANSFVLPEEGLEAELNSTGLGMISAEQDENEAAIVIDVSRDRMTVTVRFDTQNGTRLPDLEQVKSALAEKNIVFGIDDEAIQNGVQSLAPFVAAKGTPPCNGENARIERHFDLGIKGKPKLDAYDRVDYKNMNLFVLAKKGDVLAVRIMQTEGISGKDVYGNVVHAKNGRPIPLPQGSNVEIVNENQIVAAMDGQIVDTGRKISIDPHLVVSGGVGVGSGNIDFIGSVEVKGNVEAGFKVKATGDIEISGMVSGGDVEGRNVYITGGVNGMNNGVVKAKEDVRAAFTENAVIEAGRDIYIADVSLHSTLKAGKNIVMEDKRGMLTGGRIAAGEEIRCKVVGNQAFVVTYLSVGVNPAIEKRYRDVCKEYKDDSLRLKQITQMLNTLGKIDISRLPQQRIDQINELTRSQFPLAGKIKRCAKEIQDLEADLSKMKNGKIRVSDVIYPGVRISINSVLKNVQSEIRNSTLSVKDDQVTIGPY